MSHCGHVYDKFVIQHSCNIYLYYELLLQIGIMKKNYFCFAVIKIESLKFFFEPPNPKGLHRIFMLNAITTRQSLQIRGRLKMSPHTWRLTPR